MLKSLTLRGACLRLQQTNDAEIVISGPAGTGKSLACLQKLHESAERHPGFRGLIVRKTRKSLSDTGLVTFERDILSLRHYMLTDGPQRNFRQTYSYNNGSEIVVGGLDQPSRFLSGEYDLIFVQQAEEITEDDWEILTTRLRNNRLPYQQILGDCNPSTPRHWIKQREQARQMQLLESRHEDNPQLWDARSCAWTPRGRDYLSKLDALTGPRKERLRYGRWVQAEGIVYEDYDAAIHLIPRFEIPIEWRRIASVDWGFTNPGVIQVWAIDSDGRMCLTRQIYQTKKTITWWIEGAVELHKEFRLEVFACDPSEPSFIEQFHQAGLPAVGADNQIAPGLQAVQQRLKPAGDGRPRLFFLQDSLVERDPELVEAKRPTCAEEEIDCYVWANKATKDEPVKQNDHGMDAMRYAVMYVDTPPEVVIERVITYPERVTIGDYA